MKTNGFKRLAIFWMYDTNGNYLGDLDPIDEKEYPIIQKQELFQTLEFKKFAKEKNISSEQIGKVTKDNVYFMNGYRLSMEFYTPSGTEEPYNPKTNIFYNRQGQKLRSPKEYDRSDPEWTPFGDEGYNY